MEYFLFSAQTLPPETATSIFNAHRISHDKAHPTHAVGPHGLVTNGVLEEEDGSLFAVFGTAFVGDNTVLNNFASRRPGETAAACRKIADNLQDRTGTFTAIAANASSGDTEIWLDDLNSAMCFVVRNGADFAVSSNVHMLAAWLRCQGVEPTRGIEPFLSHAVFGSGLTTGDLYQEIQILRAEERPVIENGKLVIKSNDPVWPDLLSASYAELVEEAGHRVKRRMTALTQMHDNDCRIFDVTGGQDSRIVLAAIIGGGMTDEWLIHNYLAPKHPDSNFARFVSETFNLRQVRLPKTAATDLSFATAIRLDVFHAMGAAANNGNLSRFRTPGLLHVNGGFGELGGKSQDTKRFRNFQKDMRTRVEFIDEYLLKLLAVTGDDGLTPAITEWTRHKLDTEIAASMGDRLELPDMPTVFYRRGKARSHFGVASHLRSMRCQNANVLSDPFLTAAALKLGPEKSSMGRINFDLICQLGGKDIAALPLVGSRWQRPMFETKAEFEEFSKPPITRQTPPLFAGSMKPVIGPDYEELALRSEIGRADAESPWSTGINANWPAPDFGRESQFYQLAARLLEDAPTSPELAEYLPDAVIRKTMTDVKAGAPLTGPDGRFHFTRLMLFCQAEIWLRGLELAPFEG